MRYEATRARGFAAKLLDASFVSDDLDRRDPLMFSLVRYVVVLFSLERERVFLGRFGPTKQRRGCVQAV